MKQFIYITLLTGLFTACQSDKQAETYSWETDLQERLRIDFCRTEKEIRDYVRTYIPEVTDEQMRDWEARNVLEYKLIDGEKRYFRNAGPNLFRVDSACHAIKVAKEGAPLSESELVNQAHLPEVIEAVHQTHTAIVGPKRMRITYTLTVNPDAVPAGETIRCWLPFPRTDVARQREVKLLATSESSYQLAPSSCAHSTLYMEKMAKEGVRTRFSETFELTSSAEWYDLRPEDVQPYDTTTTLYRTYTAERESHIRFTPRLRALAAQLTEGETNPLLQARRLFRWVNDQFPWASAREYSTIENIPEYVLDNGHGGHSGQFTLLYLTL